MILRRRPAGSLTAAAGGGSRLPAVAVLSLLTLFAAAILNAAPPRSPARPDAAPKAGEKRIPGSGFVLQERGGLDADAEDYLGTPETEAAVRRALKWLASHQDSNGSWESEGGADVAIVGICALAFMSAGHQPDRGPYGRVLRRATDYLASHCAPTGLIYNAEGAAGPPMYGHGFATLALAELYGMTRRADLRERVDQAVRLILQTQNAEGGWRYQPRPADADISVVICQIMALRAAANAGIRVPPKTTADAIQYVKRCQENPDGGFSYMPGENQSAQARSGAGVLALIVMGEKSSPECRRGLEYLRSRSPSSRDPHLFYSLYYCTQANYQAGGRFWREWYPQLAKFLVRTQSPEGIWRDNPGPAYATGMGVLALQVPAALLPIYQK